MPRSKNIQAFPQHFFTLARAMMDNKIPPGGLVVKNTIRASKAFRQEWYAFVRAHYPSIEYAVKRRKELFTSKDDVGTKLWAGRARAWETQLETILRFELAFEVNLERDEATVTFRDKSKRGAAFAAALNAIGATTETIEDFFAGIESEIDSKRVTQHVPGTTETNLRDNPLLRDLVVMPDEERLRHGSMRYDEIRAFRAKYSDADWQAYLATITDPLIHEQIAAALSEAPQADVDNPGGAA